MAKPAEQFHHNLLGAGGVVEGLFPVLFEDCASSGVRKANSAIVQHHLKLFGRCGENPRAKVILRGLGVHERLILLSAIAFVSVATERNVNGGAETHENAQFLLDLGQMYKCSFRNADSQRLMPRV